jgi:DNA-binding PadR family transcriptional regulator
MHGILVDDGVFFSLLYIMEKKHLIKGQNRQVCGYTKRFFKITTKGKKWLHDYNESKEEIINFMKLITTNIETTTNPKLQPS